MLRVRTVETIEELTRALGLARVGHPPDDLDYVERHATDAHDRKRRDALVLATLAANSSGPVLEIGTSEGRGTSNLARNVPAGQFVVTVNILPEQADPAQRHVTHFLERDAIGAFHRALGLANVAQVYADTLRWNPGWAVDQLGLAFVDGCHDRAAVHSDSRLAYSRLAPDGLIAWHDFNPELRRRFDWIDDAMSGVEDFAAQYGLEGEIVHLRHSWVGVLRRVALPALRPARDLRLGLVVDWPFHEERRWVSALTPYLVEGLRQKFTTVLVQGQEELEELADGLDGLLSLEPGWAAPRLDYRRTPALRAALARVPMLITFSDPHKDGWRQDYFLDQGFDRALAYYRTPTARHFTRIPPQQVVEFPWAVPDGWIGDAPPALRRPGVVHCFGARHGAAYALREWCRTFPWVVSDDKSGCENKELDDAAFFAWLGTLDAVVAAGSDDPAFQLTLPKYFEIAASGALLLAQETPDLAALGFVDGVNCIAFDRSNFEARCRAYLDDPARWLSVRAAGRELVRRRHTLSQRLGELEALLRGLLEAKRG